MNAPMNVPIRYYALLEYSTASGKTPKYTITRQWGYYPPMEELRGKDGKISMYLLEKLKDGTNVPAMRLQAKNSLNFTGLKDWFTDGGKLSGYAYGYPLADETYSSKKKPNPFYEYKGDGFLFLYDTDPARMKTTAAGSTVPSTIEMVVIEGGGVLAGSYCSAMAKGGYEAEIEALREQAR